MLTFLSLNISLSHGFLSEMQFCFSLWNRVGLLVFHLALVNNPQEAFVVWAFASVLYYGVWEKGVKFAQEHAEKNVDFVPEIRRSRIDKSEEEIAKAVSQLASSVVDCIPALVEEEGLLQSLSRFPSLTCSGKLSISHFGISFLLTSQIFVLIDCKIDAVGLIIVGVAQT